VNLQDHLGVSLYSPFNLTSPHYKLHVISEMVRCEITCVLESTKYGTLPPGLMRTEFVSNVNRTAWSVAPWARCPVMQLVPPICACSPAIASDSVTVYSQHVFGAPSWAMHRDGPNFLLAGWLVLRVSFQELGGRRVGASHNIHVRDLL
jgi:hypothetical protein